MASREKKERRTATKRAKAAARSFLGELKSEPFHDPKQILGPVDVVAKHAKFRLSELSKRALDGDAAAAILITGQEICRWLEVLHDDRA